MLGLRRGLVKLYEYSSEWPKLFELEKDSILEVIGLEIQKIEHVGSTSISGLKAKPIIDIAIEVEDRNNLHKIIAPLVELGYEYFGERNIKGDFCFMKGPEEKRTHKVHVSLGNSERLKTLLKFRNSLRENRKLRNEYQSLKMELALKYPSNGKLYTQLKGEFISKVLNS